tara:strand:- start:449 stop:790 length:342 start_codon:yes stop_codon:yes gene_type:complete
LPYYGLLNLELELGLASCQRPLGMMSDSLRLPFGHVVRHEAGKPYGELGPFFLFLKFFIAGCSLQLVLLAIGAVSHPVVVTQSRAAHWEADGAVYCTNLVVHRDLGVQDQPAS